MNEFKLPPGYTCWCHNCGHSPFNKFTDVEIDGKKVQIPGIGFKTLNELSDHTRDVHRQYKG